VVVARQNGKTTFTKPLILRRLLAGRRIMHIAQVRELPRIMFEVLADAIEETSPDLLQRRRGKVIYPRRGAGSESIVLANGGEYRIASALTGGRGFSFDDLLIDELREMDSFDVINSAKHAQRFSEDPQTIYLSNMGTDASVILNSLVMRAGSDPSLAYLEWSADPSYDAGDVRGWYQANPSIGHYPQVLRDLEQDYRASKLAGNMAGFETEALCRKVPTMRERFVDEYAWMACRADEVTAGIKTFSAVAMDPAGKRASAASAWQQADGTIALTLDADESGDPVDTDALGREVAKAGRLVGFDPMTDKQLARFFPKSKPITGQEFENASARFELLVKANRLRWADADGVTGDLIFTARKQRDGSPTYSAVRANDERPITAALAAIRAVWLASEKPSTGLKVY
jgi:hypothetical protein